MILMEVQSLIHLTYFIITMQDFFNPKNYTPNDSSMNVHYRGIIEEMEQKYLSTISTLKLQNSQYFEEIHSTELRLQDLVNVCII